MIYALGFVYGHEILCPKNFPRADVQRHLIFATDTLSFLVSPVFGIPPEIGQ